MNDYTDADAPPADEETPTLDHSLLAEQSVLGGMMLSTNAVDDVMAVITPGDFWQPKHELIAVAIGTLRNRNEPTDVIAVTEELRRTEKLDRAGGAAYLHELTDSVPSASNAGYYALTLKQTAAKRRLVAAGIRIQAMGANLEGEADELIDLARVELEHVMSAKSAKLRKIGDTFPELVDALTVKPEYAPTPWESLDRLIGGFAPGCLYIFAARPGAGKSIAVLQIAAKLAHYGMVALSSLEMTEMELQKRLLAQYGPVHMTGLRSHSLSQDDWKRIAEAKHAVQEAPIFVDDQAGVTLSQIRTHARSVQRVKPLSGIVVDYLQLVKGEGQSRQEVVADVAEGLKHIAKDFGVPVIAAAQLRRAGERRGAKKLPDLDDLRESGAIEQAADCVILMDRDKEKNPGDLVMVVAKNRHGEAGRFTLQWQAQFARLRDKKWTPTGLFESEEVA